MLAEYELARESDERFYFRTGNDEVCTPHFHRKLEILYILSGKKSIICNNKTFVLNEGEIFIADSYVMHGYLESKDSKQIVIVIPNHMLDDYYLLYSNMALTNFFIRDKEVSRYLKEIIDKLIKPKNNPLTTKGLINILLGEIVKYVGVKEKIEKLDLTSMEEVLAYINENFTEEITLDDLAAKFGYSKYHFSRMFNKLLNTNLSTYLSMVRLQAAIEKLKKDNCSSIEAALSSRFSSMQTFYRVFKKYYSFKRIKDILNNEEL